MKGWGAGLLQLSSGHGGSWAGRGREGSPDLWKPSPLSKQRGLIALGRKRLRTRKLFRTQHYDGLSFQINKLQILWGLCLMPVMGPPHRIPSDFREGELRTKEVWLSFCVCLSSSCDLVEGIPRKQNFTNKEPQGLILPNSVLWECFQFPPVKRASSLSGKTAYVKFVKGCPVFPILYVLGSMLKYRY